METFGIGVKQVKVSVFVFYITLQRGIAYLDIDLITASHDVTDGPFEICGSDLITMWCIHRGGWYVKSCVKFQVAWARLQGQRCFSN